MVLKSPKCSRLIGSSAVTLVIVLPCCLATRCGNTPPSSPPLTAAPRTYTTHFPNTEDPLSEGGAWIDGYTVGRAWSDVESAGGEAFGVIENNSKNMYDDSTALLTGEWGPNQTVTATLFVTGTISVNWPEVELRLRSALSANMCSGYEIDFAVSNTATPIGMAIVRWNGPPGNFTYVARYSGPQYGVNNGDVIQATISGSRITVYKNGTQLAQATDSTYAAGAPGLGFDGPIGTNSAWGFTRYSATDGPVQVPSDPAAAGSPSAPFR